MLRCYTRVDVITQKLRSGDDFAQWKLFHLWYAILATRYQRLVQNTLETLALNANLDPVMYTLSPSKHKNIVSCSNHLEDPKARPRSQSAICAWTERRIYDILCSSSSDLSRERYTYGVGAASSRLFHVSTALWTTLLTCAVTASYGCDGDVLF